MPQDEHLDKEKKPRCHILLVVMHVVIVLSDALRQVSYMSGMVAAINGISGEVNVGHMRDGAP